MIELVDDPADWNNLANLPDVYFGGGYGSADALRDESHWCTLVAHGGAWQVPLVLRRTDETASDASSPYGYSGVYASPDLGPKLEADLWQQTLAALRDLGVVSLFVRHSPVVPQSPLRGSTPLVTGHETRLVDLTSDDAMWSGMEGRSRTSIRKALRTGHSAHLRPPTEDELIDGSAFHLLYEAAMDRRQASDLYYFPDDYYRRLRDRLGTALLLGEVVNEDAQVVAASLFLVHQPLMHYHLSGASPDGARVGATNLLIWAAMQYGAAHGCHGLHLGGGVETGDSLLRFKRSFGGRALEYRASAVVVNQNEYVRLCGNDSSGPRAGEPFPPYRFSTNRSPDG